MSYIYNMNDEIRDITLLVFSAEWCGPCQRMKPIVDSIGQNMNIKVLRFDVDSNKRMSLEFSITSLPTFILVKEDHMNNYTKSLELSRHLGSMTEFDFKNWIIDTAQKFK